MDTYKAVGGISIAISVFTLLQFVIGSYQSKMIGLETLHVLQIAYFARLMINQDTTSLLGSMNKLKYSNGYNGLPLKSLIANS
jgi:ABC-type Fe3+ transport system permease subunit